MLKRTLMPLSLNESHDRLVDMARYLKKFGTESISLFHVLEGNGNRRREKNQKLLSEVASKIEPLGFSVETGLQEGNNVAEQICRKAGEVNADFISIKWKPKNVIRRAILGSPDADLLRICDYSTFFYKNRAYLQREIRMQNLLYATEFTETDRQVLPYLEQVSRSAEKLYVLHVRERAPDPETDQRLLERINEKMERFREESHYLFQSVTPLVSTGSVRAMISRQARQHDADLILIGKKDPRNPMEKLVGSTAEALPYRSHCSILMIA